MSQAPTPQQFLAALKRWHVDVVELPGWQTHNRTGHGAWGDMHGVVNHATVTAPSIAPLALAKGVLWNGRPDLPGPLCHASPGRDGRLYLVGWGRANHAGSVRPEVLAALQADRVPTRPTTTSGETVDGNAFTYGLEWQNDGVGETYPTAQIECGVRTNAALLEIHGWRQTSAVQHSEITRRKVDMGRINGIDAGPWLRLEIARALAFGPDAYSLPPIKAATVHVQATPPKPQPAKETPMALVLYAARGTVDAITAFEWSQTHARGFVTSDLADTKAQAAAGARVLAVGGPACDDLRGVAGVEPVNGSDAAQTAVILSSVRP